MRLKNRVAIKDDAGRERSVGFIEHLTLADFRGRFRANCYYEGNQAFTLFFRTKEDLDAFLNQHPVHPHSTGDEVDDYIEWRKALERGEQ